MTTTTQAPFLESLTEAIVAALETTTTLMLTDAYWQDEDTGQPQRSRPWLEWVVSERDHSPASQTYNKTQTDVKLIDLYLKDGDINKTLTAGNSKFNLAWNNYVDTLPYTFTVSKIQADHRNTLNRESLKDTLQTCKDTRDAHRSLVILQPENYNSAALDAKSVFISYSHRSEFDGVFELQKIAMPHNEKKALDEKSIRILSDEKLPADEKFALSLYGMLLIADQTLFFLDRVGFYDCIYRENFLRNFEAVHVNRAISRKLKASEDVLLILGEGATAPPKHLMKHVFGEEIAKAQNPAAMNLLQFNTTDFSQKFVARLLAS